MKRMIKLAMVGILIVAVMSGLSCTGAKSPAPVSEELKVPEWPPAFYPLQGNSKLASGVTVLHTKVMMPGEWWVVKYGAVVDKEELISENRNGYQYNGYHAEIHFWLGDSELGGENGYSIKGKLEIDLGNGRCTDLELTDVQVYPKDKNPWSLAVYLESLQSLNDVDDYFLRKEACNLIDEFCDVVVYPLLGWDK